MNSFRQLESDVLLEESIAPTILAEAQWALLQDLESQYAGKKVKGLASYFEDDVWFALDGSRKHTCVNWASYFGTNRPGLKILCKLIYFEMAATTSIAPNTMNSRWTIFKNTIGELLAGKGLLAGNRGEYLLGLNHITDVDLLAMFDARLVLVGTEKGFISECSDVGSWMTMAKIFAEAAPVFEIRAQLPWSKAGLTLNEWGKRRATDLGEVFRDVQGYAPLVPEAAQPLIERSLYLILKHHEHLAELVKLSRAYKWDQKFDGPAPAKILKKYGPIFADVATPPKIDGLPNTARKLSLIFIWIRQLIYLVRGACLNVILCTSGLRNSDICRLKIGACKPSGRIDMLYYLSVYIMKTKNFVVLPVPEQTHKAVTLLEALKETDSEYLVDTALFASNTHRKYIREEDARIANETLNSMLRGFADHFNIPFHDPHTGKQYSAHNYRTTVAGWLDAHSNLSILLVRRLFGHSNDVMPTVYLRNNPSFVQTRQEQKEQAAAETARQMALAASQGKLAGAKGEQLQRGYQAHVSRLETAPQESHSLTDVELVLSFSKLIEQRIVDGTICGFLTPFGVLCGRNPSDSSQPPCAKRSHSDKTREIAKEVLQHLNDIDPENCIGTSCDQAMVGPWSEPLKESLLWYAGLVRHQHGEAFNKKEFVAHAKAFIRQYSQPIRKVFRIQVFPDGSVNHDEGTKK